MSASSSNLDNSGTGVPTPGTGLSTRLLILTLVFVMVSEVMVFLPSIARFRERYLEERLATAHVAILAIETMPDGPLDQGLKERLLKHADTYAIEEEQPDGLIRRLQLNQPPPVDATIALQPMRPLTLVFEALATLLRTQDRTLRVIGPSIKEPDLRIRIIIDEKPMREAMIGYSGRILLLSLIIALFTGMLIYFSLRKLIVTPMQNLTENMQGFRENPEDPGRIIKPGTRLDEIGIAEKNLAFMQRDIRASLTQKARLVAIGEAVAKVNHDLRNILANAMLQGDKLARIRHPQVRETVPILFKTIDEAVTLCRRTLDFVSNPQEQFHPKRLDLRVFITETLTPFLARHRDAESLLKKSPGKSPKKSHRNPLGKPKKKPHFENAVAADLSIMADPQQLSRVILNLVENSIESGADIISFQAQKTPEKVILLVKDNGPGVPASVRSNLFAPFNRSKKSRGTGLGLAIVRDIMRAHDGGIRLKSSSKRGTVFALNFPVKELGDEPSIRKAGFPGR